MDVEIIETEYDVFYFADDIKDTLTVQEKDIFSELIQTKINVLKDFDIKNGGASNLNKFVIEDYAPKEKVEEQSPKKEKKKISLLSEKE
jgi:hypothetical protein